MTFRTKRIALVTLGFLGAAAAVLALLLSSTVGASEYLIQQKPESGSTVAEAPHQLLLTFDLNLAQISGAHHVEVTDHEGYRVDNGHADISGYSLRTLVVPIHAEGDGELEVSYTVQLVEGDQTIPVSSSYRFTIDHEYVPIEGDAIDALAVEKSGQGLVLWTIAILIGIALVGALVYFLRMATGTSRSSLEPTNRSVFRD